MKNQELFHKTIGILVNAYFNDTLVYADCAACAVGNLIACANSVKLVRQSCGNIIEINGRSSGWEHIIDLGQSKLRNERCFDGEIVDRMLKTGYSLYELALIEGAFYEGTEIERGQPTENFNGLMSVCDTLMQIHEATTEEIKEAKGLFVKELAV